jgi:hypothetical protein
MPDEASEKPTPSNESAASAPAASETHATGAATGGETDAEDAAGASAVATEAAPAKRRKKKRKKPVEEAPAVPLEPPLTQDGRERPLFVLAFPKDPELDRLVQAFEAGNYAFVREHAPKLAERTTSAEVRDAARELARRIEPDPLVKLLLGLSIALFVVLAIWAYKTHGG